MWELEYKESWALKNWCFWTVVLKKILESPLDWKEIRAVHPKWDQSWVFIGRIDIEAKTPILWPPHAKSWLIGKQSDAGRDRGQEEKGTTEDEMAGWHHWLNGRESEWTPGVDDGQGGLSCWDSWGRKESDTTERLIWSDLINLLLDFQDQISKKNSFLCHLHSKAMVKIAMLLKSQACFYVLNLARFGFCKCHYWKWPCISHQHRIIWPSSKRKYKWKDFQN